MAKTWVLDTETKGTGAHIVPLEKTLRKPAPEAELALVKRPRPEPGGPDSAEAPAPRPPRRFKIVDIMTRQVLAEGVDVRATIDVLKGIRSIVDVSISLWDAAAEEWRPLTLRDEKVLWGLRDAA
jgi:hypothetical protein